MTKTDVFWQGRIKLLQPENGFRAGTASLLLAASLPSKARGLVYDFGAGVGTLGILATTRNPNIQTIGYELDEQAADLATRNIALNDCGQVCQVLHQDVSDAKPSGGQADWLMTNPPFTQPGKGRQALQASKSLAHQAQLSFEQWLGFTLPFLRPGGRVICIMPATQLQTCMLAASRLNFGDCWFHPIHSFADKPAKLVVMSWRKNRAGSTQILPALTLYDTPNTLSRAAFQILQQGCGMMEAMRTAKGS